ncbi:MAG: glutathione binding-like protein [Kofleriaceae bacterium]
MIDAYVWTTPNGFKLLIGLEELGLPYRTHWVDITKGDQRKPEYIAVNPNSKIPAIVDPDTSTTVFESGAVLIYLAEKAGKLLPASGPARYQTLEWVFFNVGGPGPMFGQLGFFAKFAKEKVPMAIERYEAEAKRLLQVLDTRLGETKYLAGSEFTIADIINFTWANAGRTFLGLDYAPYPHLVRWLDELQQRPAFLKALAMKPDAT